MAFEFKTQRMVEFAETDMAGILHFANFYRYMEATEHEFFRSLGLRVHMGSEKGAWGWARVRADCTFLKPLRYEDVVEVHLLVSEKRSKSITYQVTFRKDGEVVARGDMTVVCVAKPEADGPLQSALIPDAVNAAVEVAPAELLEGTSGAGRH